MMSVNAVLMKFFKLPPAVRMMLALLGFGSLASILFRFLPGLRSTKGMIWMAIIFGVGLVVFIIFWLVRRLFFRKKSSQLSEALESQGPTRGDIAEQEQIYREKFKSKLAELKTNGLNVYKLPWFVLMGEPGCGKTASLIHSGLDFPLGKDEVPGFGGTRNYNWWFANDAVVLDTAGRIAFQEEGTTDKVEWEYFLKMLKTHRQRCPVNGVVIALPADKLLRDSSEERAQKAAVLRERLRQVHQSLGVRFPTFVLVTKMDLAGGFSEFFEEIRVDLLQRNQMFGWSRPGEFEESYDPAGFPAAFESVYGRLRNWSMRYLQRKATEDELGMIVTFPESFRQLRGPLEEYIATIFQKSPLLEPPFFRGFYFTSAVQEGAPIFDVFSKSKAGVTIAERPTRAVDSKAFFIHDFYAKKVFPEHGLVFRSARHVSLNKRMRRLVWYGSAAMVLLMITMFGFGITGVHSLLTSPREDCRIAGEAIASEKKVKYEDLAGSLRTAKALQAHYQAYSKPLAGFYARMLFIGADIHVPESYVGQIHSRFVLDCVVRPIMREVEDRLANTEITVTTDAATRERYLAALCVYIKWYGEVVGQSDLNELDAQEAVGRGTEFEDLLAFLGLAEADSKDAAGQFEAALMALSEEPRSFAREILRDGVGFDEAEATQTILAAIDRITESWKPLTQLSADNANAMVKFWADFADHVAELRRRYDAVLTLSGQFAQIEQYQPAVDEFMALTTGVQHMGDPDIHPEANTLHEAYFNLMTFLESAQVPETADHRVIRFGGLLDVFASKWNAEFGRLRAALEHGAPDTTGNPQAAVYAALDRGREDLTTAFQLSLDEIRAKLGLPADVEPLTYYVEQRLIDVIEANPPQKFDGPVRLVLARDALGPNERLKRYLMELRDLVGGQQRDLKDLDDLHNWTAMLGRLSGGRPSGKLLDSWFSGIDEEAEASRAGVIRQRSGLADHLFWRPVDLYGLARQMWDASRGSSSELLMSQMSAKARSTMVGDDLRGLARLMPGYDQPSSLPFDQHRFNRSVSAPPPPPPAPEKPAAEEPPAEEPEDDSGLGRLGRRRGATPAEPAPAEPGAPAQPIAREDTTALLYNYHTLEFLRGTLRQCELVAAELRARPGGDAVIEPLSAAANAYVDAYFTDWYEIYSDPTRLLDEQTLTLIEKCGSGALSWPEFVDVVTGPETDIASALANRTEALVREVVFFDAGLEENAVDDAVYQRIGSRLAELDRQQRSVPNLCVAMRRTRNMPGPSDGAPPVVYGGQIVSGWSEYVRQVRSLGPLTDEAKRTTGAPPDLEKLAESVVYKQATTPQFPLIAPLMDIATYGEKLLAHHLESRLAALFARHAGEYPLIQIDAAHDSSALLSGISGRKTCDPKEFIELLKLAVVFQQRYGELYQDVQGDSPANETLRRCAAWVAFLYDSPDALMGGQSPRPRDVWVTIVRDNSGDVGNAANVYSKLTLTLPLLTANGTAATPLERLVRAGEGITASSVQEAIGGGSAQYRWDLFVGSGVSYDRMTVVVSDKHPDARGDYPARLKGWDLPGNPWSLLMAMTARSDNDLSDGYWKIPVRMESSDEPVGFLVGIKIGDRDRSFPGVIPPLSAPGNRPQMSEAARYLSARP